MSDSPILVAMGNSIKSLSKKGDLVTLGAKGVLWGDSDRSDLLGDWFTPQTNFGARKGLGVDTMLHHGYPLSRAVKGNSRLLPPTTRVEFEDDGLWVETVYDLRDAFQRKIIQLVEDGALSWSSGCNDKGMVRANNKDVGAEILQWPIMEFSLTPTPCEPRVGPVLSLKSLLLDDEPNAVKAISVLESIKTAGDIETNDADNQTKSFPNLSTLEAGLPDGLTFSDHSKRVLAANEEFIERLVDRDATRAASRKSGRVYSADNWDHMDGICNALGDLHEKMRGHLDNHKPDQAIAVDGKSAPAIPQGVQQFRVLQARMVAPRVISLPGGDSY